MYGPLPTELYLQVQPGSARAIEHVCGLAVRRPEGDAVAVAVAPSHVSRASNLLFGTGIGVVSALGENELTDMLAAARLSVVTGATEIALSGIVLDESAILGQLKTFLGSSIPLTVEITSPTGDADLSTAEQALVLGADFVSFAPRPTTANPSNQTANLVALAGELQLGGVKVASPFDHHVAVLRSNRWALFGNARQCLPIPSPAGDLRP